MQGLQGGPICPDSAHSRQRRRSAESHRVVARRHISMTAPSDFIEEVSRAERRHARGDLLLLADEVTSFAFPWRDEGLGIVRAAEHRMKPIGRVVDKVLVFTGHRIDAPGRAKQRFPAVSRTIETALELIAAAVREEHSEPHGRMVGLAGGASGGDILFHEECARVRIPTSLFLAAPRAEYVKISVADAGTSWVRRFDRLHDRLERRVLSKSLELPQWLSAVAGYNIWQRSNLWILHNAFAIGAPEAVVIALWNGEGGDGPGGTDDMIVRARQHGARTVILDAKLLLDGISSSQ